MHPRPIVPSLSKNAAEGRQRAARLGKDTVTARALDAADTFVAGGAGAEFLVDRLDDRRPLIGRHHLEAQQSLRRGLEQGRRGRCP